MKRFVYLLLAVAACSSTETTTPSGAAGNLDSGAAAAATDAGAPDDASDAALAFDGSCVVPQGFGDELSEGFGRIDGYVSAIQMPNDQSCTMPNRDHLILQVMMKGEIHRMVVNTDVSVLELPHALPAPSFAEGWHTGVSLDYATDLGAHSPSFTDPGEMDATVQKMLGAGLAVGDAVSVYATSGAGRPESAHLVHRNTKVAGTDGAIVVRPDGASPTFLLFAFADQTF